MKSITTSQIDKLYELIFMDFKGNLPTVPHFKNEVKYHKMELDEKYLGVVDSAIAWYKKIYKAVNKDKSAREITTTFPNPFVGIVMLWILSTSLVRDQRYADRHYDCSMMLDVGERLLETQKMNEGDYLDFCNKLKLLNSLQDIAFIEQLDYCDIIEND